jgi:hypothetical protein
MKVILNIPDEGYSEHTWWRLFWTYLMKVILNIPDEGYSEHTWWRLFWTYLMKVILNIPDEGYSEHTWWRLFQKRVVHTKGFYLYYNFSIFLVHLDQRSMWTIAITWRPSSVVCRLSSVVCRLSSVNFSHFKLLLRNHLADWNRT